MKTLKNQPKSSLPAN